MAPLRFAVWRDALISAHLAQTIAAKRGLDAAEAFLAGLLHNFGQVVAIACLETIIETWDELSPMPADFWWQITEAYHLELGLVMAAKWDLPEVYQEVIAHHHDAERGSTPLVALMSTVDAVTTALTTTSCLEAIDFSAWFPDEDEREAVVAICSHLPRMVAAFSAGGVDDAHPACWVASPDAKGGVSVEFTVEYLSDRDPARWTAVTMADAYLRVRSDRAIHENTLIRIAITWGADRFELWANVATTLKGPDASWFIDLIPFALAKEDGERWTRWLLRLALPDDERDPAMWDDVLKRLAARGRSLLLELSTTPTKELLAKAAALLEEEEEKLKDMPEAIAARPEIAQQITALSEIARSLRETLSDAAEALTRGRRTSPAKDRGARHEGSRRSRRSPTPASPGPRARGRTILFVILLGVLIAGRLLLYLTSSASTSPPAHPPAVIIEGNAQTTLAPADPSMEKQLDHGIPVILGVTLARQKNEIRATTDAIDDSNITPHLTYVWFEEGKKLPGTGPAIEARPGKTYQVEVTASDGSHTSRPMKSDLFRTR